MRLFFPVPQTYITDTLNNVEGTAKAQCFHQCIELVGKKYK